MKTANLRIQLKKLITVGTCILLIIGLISFIGLKTYIKVQANEVAQYAVVEFQKSKTDALLAMIVAENYSFENKNKAIWALGVLKAEEALPKLQSLHTGDDCNHKTELCQYEIEKAIKRIK